MGCLSKCKTEEAFQVAHSSILDHLSCHICNVHNIKLCTGSYCTHVASSHAMNKGESYAHSCIRIYKMAVTMQMLLGPPL